METGKNTKQEMSEKDAHKNGPDTGTIPLPEITFASFILSLNISALVHLGELPEPGKDKPECNLDLARHAIDTIAMLKEKTQGNLDEEEARLIDNILFDLRMKFVKKST